MRQGTHQGYPTPARAERISCWTTWRTDSSNRGARGESAEPDGALEAGTMDVGGSSLGDAMKED